jgi:tetratricopeptide (TPR) repeat protein
MRGRNRLLRRYFRLLFGLTFFLNSGLALALPSQETSRPPFDHVPPSSFVRPEPLVFRALSQADIDWVLCFWKAEGADDFDSYRSSFRLEQAIEEFKKALDLDPGYPEALNLAGYTYLDSGNFETAAEYFKRSVSVLPGKPNPLDS